MRISRIKSLLAALAIIALAAFAGCVSGSGGRVITPAPEESEFSRLWPNADGNSWTYDYQRHFATESIIPQIDGLSDLDVSEIDYLDLEARLNGDLPARGEVEDIGIMTLEFRGTIPSLDGPKQNLESTFEPIEPAFASRRDAADTRRAFGASSRRAVSPLMARIYAARPDLREAMIAKGYVTSDADKVLSPQALPPFQFSGAKFEKQEGWIGTYGDISADSAYTFLQAPLIEGAFFRHQLVPDLSEDIWEYAWVLGARTIETTAGVFDEAVGVVYFLDFGFSRVVDDQGNAGQEFRSFTISAFYFAPDVGPVYQRTIDALFPPLPEFGIEIGTLFSEVSLRGFEID